MPQYQVYFDTLEGERRFARILFALLLLGPLCGFVAWRCHAVRAFTSERITAADGTTSSIFCGNSLGKEAVSDAGEIGVALVDSKQYVVAFEVAGLLLVVALVAALSIARRRELELEDAS